MDENQQNNVSGGLVPPPPPSSDIKIRTMDSDIKSVGETGGGTPEPEVINPSDIGNVGGPVFTPETSVPEAPAPSVKEESQKMRPWIFWILIIVLLIVLGIIGYFLITPLVFPAEVGGEPTETEVATSTVEIIPPAAPVHQSAFNLQGDKVAKLAISNLSLVSVIAALQGEATKTLPTGDFKEVYFEVAGKLAKFSEYLAVLLPEIVGSDAEVVLKTSYNDDFSAFLYYDDNGAWPGYVIKKKDLTFVNDIGLFADIETASVGNVFLTPPLGRQDSFRAGTVGKHANRYAPYPQSGVSFSYGLFDDYLIISTNYNGLLKVAEALGL